MKYLSLCIIFLPFLFIFNRSDGQDEQSGIVRKLTNDNRREWRLSGMTTTLGGCEDGIVLLFSKDSVVCRNCVNGKWVIINEKWKAAKAKNQWMITIGQQLYQLIFGVEGKKDRMVLRTVIPGKEGATIDRIFVSERNR